MVHWFDLLALHLDIPTLAIVARCSLGWARAVRRAVRHRQADLSLGAESVPVPCENTVDGELVPLNGAHYICECMGARPARLTDQ